MNIKQLTILSFSLIILGLLYLGFSVINMNLSRQSMLVYNLVFGIASLVAGVGTGIYIFIRKDILTQNSMEKLLAKLSDNNEFPFELEKFSKYCGVNKDKASKYLNSQTKIALIKSVDDSGKILFNLPEVKENFSE